MGYLAKIDILFYVLRYTLFTGIFGGVQRDIENGVEGSKDVLEAITENTHKHSMILYLTTVGTFLVYLDLKDFTHEQIMLMLTIVLPLSAIMGVSWYVITFGAIPAKYLRVAMYLTLAMCYAFIQSIAIMMLVIVVILPLGCSLTISAVIIAVYISSVLYDTMDLLKAGIDEEALLFYRTARTKMRNL